MSTGLETWTQNLNEVGPLYPFVGTEFVLAVVGIGIWAVWHVIQIRGENAKMKEEKQRFSDKAKLEKAMDVSNAESLHISMDGHASDFN